MGTSCYVKGGEALLASLKKDYGLEPGGITGDGKFSLEMVRCLGCCGLSPVMTVGEDVHRKVRPGEVKAILSSYNRRVHGETTFIRTGAKRHSRAGSAKAR